MKTISRWASRHKWAARFLIVLAHGFLFSIAVVAGTICSTTGVEFPSMILTFLMISFLALVFKYPTRHRRPLAIRYSYWKARMMDAALITTSVCMIIAVTAQSETLRPYPQANEYRVINVVHENTPKNERIHRKTLRRSFRQEVRNFLHSNKERLSHSAVVLLSVLLILLTLAAFFAVLALSCSIACSGAEGIALLVFFSGVALVGLLCVLGMRWLLSKDERRQNGPTTS